MSQVAPPPPSPPPFYSPPTLPGPLGRPASESRWPAVVGTLAIVLGVLGSICHVFGAFGPLIHKSMFAAMPKGSIPFQEVQDRWAGWTMANEAIAALIAVVCIVGGIGLLQRAVWSVRILRGWGVVAILHGIGTGVLQYQLTNETFHSFASSSMTAGAPASMPAGAQVAMQGGMMIGVCMSVVWNCGFPGFVLIWLARGSIREEVARWGGKSTSLR